MRRGLVVLLAPLMFSAAVVAQTPLVQKATPETVLAKVSPDLDDLSATFAVALLKLGLATGFVEQRHPGFAKEIEVKRQRVIAALQQEQQQQQQPKH